MIIVPTTVHSQVDDRTFSKLESGLIIAENPFKSQLPKIEEPKIEIADDLSDQETAEGSSMKLDIPKPPVEPPVVEERPLPSITVSGIIWNSDRPQAIINGQIVDVGDTVSEIQITGIRKAAIDGFFDGRNVTLQP